jgi:hypothetical protein
MIIKYGVPRILEFDAIHQKAMCYLAKEQA